MDYITLNTGAKMPTLGLGTWKSQPNEVADAVEHAINKCGYKHIDCAAIYGNEPEIGEIFKKIFPKNPQKRDEIFITSKLWNTEHKKERVKKACQQSLDDLNLGYLDLYLMHWGIATPAPNEDLGTPSARAKEFLDKNGVLVTEKVPVRETWEAMEELVSEGLVKAIGISNFTAPMINDLLAYAKIPPAMNQVELHPYLQQQKLVEFCKEKGIANTAYSPLGSPGNFKNKGLPSDLEDKEILEIADAHDKTPAQVIIRWGIQRRTVTIPKSADKERILENSQVYDFELSDQEMGTIAKIDKGLRVVDPYDWWKIPYFN